MTIDDLTFLNCSESAVLQMLSNKFLSIVISFPAWMDDGWNMEHLWPLAMSRSQS